MLNVEHAGFILASYLIASVVIIGLILWVVLDHRAQKMRLQRLEEQGAQRRSGAKLS